MPLSKEKARNYYRVWRAKNPEKARAATAWNRVRRKAMLVVAMGGSCQSCGEDRLGLLDFHHRYPERKTSPTFWRGKLTVAVWAELWLCDLLCGNCHRLVEMIHENNSLTAFDIIRNKEDAS